MDRQRWHFLQSIQWIVVILLCILLAGAVVLAGDDRDNWQQPTRVMADLAIRPGVSVADVGCGYGYFTFRLREAVGEQGTVFAVDVNPQAIEAVKQTAARQHVVNVKATVSESTDPKLPPASLDICLMCDVIHEVPEDSRLPLIQNIAQAIKPGGYFYLIDYRKSKDVPFDPYERLIPHDDLVKLGTDAGFTLDAEYHYLQYQVFLRFRKAPSAPPGT